MSRHNIDFIAFDFTAEDLDGLALDDRFAELGGHRLGLVGVEIQLLSDLFIGEVQATAMHTISWYKLRNRLV